MTSGERTRGVDVGARAEIYRHLRTLADQGLTIIFVSSDNQEVLGLADTIATFFRGRLVRVAPPPTCGLRRSCATSPIPRRWTRGLPRDLAHPHRGAPFRRRSRYGGAGAGRPLALRGRDRRRDRSPAS